MTEGKDQDASKPQGEAGDSAAPEPPRAPSSAPPSTASTPRPRAKLYLLLNAGFWAFLVVFWLIMRSMLARNWGPLAHPEEFRAPDRGIILFCLMLAGAFALVTAFDYVTRRPRR